MDFDVGSLLCIGVLLLPTWIGKPQVKIMGAIFTSFWATYVIDN